MIAKFKTCLIFLVPVISLSFSMTEIAHSKCGSSGVYVQVLGSGGPEINDKRASSSYLIWIDQHARILVDLGAGTMLQFEHSGAQVSDLDIILFSHLHVDHIADLPALIKGSYFTTRHRNLPVYGPVGNQLMPSMTSFIESLFKSAHGVLPYLDDYLSDNSAFRLLPINVTAGKKQKATVVDNDRMTVSSIAVHHGPIPALAWRVDIGNESIVFSGDMNGDYKSLEKLANDADLLIAHHAIPERATGIARKLHMPPSVIGDIAAKADVKKLVLSHRMRRTLGHEDESAQIIKQVYHGPVVFAEDGQCFIPN